MKPFLCTGAIAVLIFLAMSPATAEDFRGYPCTQDCSGHIAGYEWAKAKGITSRDQCGGKSHSFIEGCWAWVDELPGADPGRLEPPRDDTGADPRRRL